MSLFTAMIGELTSRMGRTLDDPAAPANFALASSIFALAMGSFWTCRAVAGLGGIGGVASALAMLLQWLAALLPGRAVGA